MTRELRPNSANVSTSSTALVKHYRKLLLAFEADLVASAGTKVGQHLGPNAAMQILQVCMHDGTGPQPVLAKRWTSTLLRVLQPKSSRSACELAPGRSQRASGSWHY